VEMDMRETRDERERIKYRNDKVNELGELKHKPTCKGDRTNG